MPFLTTHISYHTHELIFSQINLLTVTNTGQTGDLGHCSSLASVWLSLSLQIFALCHHIKSGLSQPPNIKYQLQYSPFSIYPGLLLFITLITDRDKNILLSTSLACQLLDGFYSIYCYKTQSLEQYLAHWRYSVTWWVNKYRLQENLWSPIHICQVSNLPFL